MFALLVIAMLPGQEKASLDLRAPDDTVLIAADEIVSYEWATHTLVLKPGVAERLRKSFFETKVVREFTLAVGGKAVYGGEFMSVVMSRTSGKVVILVDGPASRPERLRVQLGYPTEKEFRGKDPRGDERVKQAGKVK